MKPPSAPTGAINADHAALFRRLVAQLATSPTPFEAAPQLSLVLARLADGARPNELLGWKPAEAGERLPPYFRALLDAYLDHLVFAEADPSDVQQVNQLLQDILDGSEPDRVLEYAQQAPGSPRSTPRARQVVYAFSLIRELAALHGATAARDAPGADDPGLYQQALERVAERCQTTPSTVASAYADATIRAEAQKLVDFQSGLTPEMAAAAVREAGAASAPGEAAPEQAGSRNRS